MRKRRAITAVEPIERDAVFVANSEGSFDRERPGAGLILAISVRFQIGACGKFPLICAESLASSAKTDRDLLCCSNLRTPFLRLASTYDQGHVA